jgi:hypothetical protein
MKFINAEIRPGVIKEVVDTIGTIRADVYGLFTSEDAEEIGHLPPIKPMTMLGNRGSFSTPHTEDKIWVISSNVDSRLLYYIPYFDNEIMTDLITNGEALESVTGEDVPDVIEVLLNVDDDGQVVQILYNTDNVLIIKNNASSIKMYGNEKKIEIYGDEEGDSIVTIEGSKVILGKEDQAILNGDDTSSLLKDILTEIDAIYTIFTSILPTMVASASPMTVMGLASVAAQIPNVSKGKANVAKLKQTNVQSKKVFAQT